jgi:hypothetical protein
MPPNASCKSHYIVERKRQTKLVPGLEGLCQLLRRTSVEMLIIETSLSIHLRRLPTIQVRHYPHTYQHNSQHRGVRRGVI